MSSFEQRYYVRNATLLQRLRRDVRLAWENLSFLFLWLTRGRRIRRAYRRAQDADTQLIIEDLFTDRDP